MVRNKKWEWTEGDDRRLLENEGGWQILDFDCREVEGNPRVIDGRLSILRKQIAEGQDPVSAADPMVTKPNSPAQSSTQQKARHIPGGTTGSFNHDMPRVLTLKGRCPSQCPSED